MTITHHLPINRIATLAQPRQSMTKEVEAPVDAVSLDAIEAAQSPLLDPGMQLAVALGLARSLLNPNEAVTVDFRHASDQGVTRGTFALDANAEIYPVSMQADVDGKEMRGMLTVSPYLEHPRWSTYDPSNDLHPDGLDIIARPENDGLRVRGQLQGVATDLEVSLAEGGILVDGTIGKHHFNTRTTVPLETPGPNIVTVTTEGSLDHLPINKHYTLEEAGTDWVIRGGGTSLGSNTEFEALLKAQPR